MKKPVAVESASALIDDEDQGAWGLAWEDLAKVRETVHEADVEIVEEWKWRGTPVWSHGGIVCTGETYKNHVKMTFAKGVSVEGPFGSSSTPALTGMPGAPSTSTNATSLMKRL